MMQKSSKIYVAGHKGLVGSSVVKELQAQGFTNLILRSHQELDLCHQQSVEVFFESEKPEYIFLAAAKVGGIWANNQYPADFIYQNLSIQNHVIHQAYVHQVKRLIFLGSSCIYPRECPQPIQESYLMTGPLEPTNRAYALAKIAGIEMCRSYNQQYGTQFLSVMPTNLYGPNDHYDLMNSHVIPALIRKIHEAKVQGTSKVVLWGTGRPKREFLYVEDLAKACVFLLNLDSSQYQNILADNLLRGVINIGVGVDLTIAELAQTIAEVLEHPCEFEFDTTKPDGVPRKVLGVQAIQALGWSAQVSLTEGLQRTYASYSKQAVC